jgi:hypothetical protein
MPAATSLARRKKSGTKTMPQLKSSNLATCDYSAETRTLSVTFKSGGTYSYANVDEATYQGLLSAASPGRYFAENIKETFSFTKG